MQARTYTFDMTQRDSLHVTPAAASETATLRMMMLHGIYGRGRNWMSMAREIAAARPEWGALLVDLRLHGDSPAFDPPHTVDAAAADVAGGHRGGIVERRAGPGPRWVIRSAAR